MSLDSEFHLALDLFGGTLSAEMGSSASIQTTAPGRGNTSNRNEPTVELVPGFSVTKSEVSMMVDLVSDNDGLVSVSRLSTYLASEGLDASDEDIKEMLRMLPSSWITATDATNLVEEEEQQNTYGVDYSHEMDTYTPQEPYEPKIYHDVNSPSRKVQELVWKSFLNRSFAVGDISIQEHILEASAIEQRESYVFIAIPALTFLDLITTPNDFDNPLSLNQEYLKFGDDAIISINSCPGEWKLPLKSILDARFDLYQSEKSDNTLRSRLKLALAADPDEGISFDDREEDGPINRIRGKLQGAATAITQTSQFRDTFESVLDLLEAVASP